MRPLFLLFVPAVLASCQASVEMNASSPKKEEVEPPEPPPSKETVAAPAVRTQFFGVTHALTLSPEAAKTPRCRCMAAVIGTASNPAFVWRGTPPTVGDDGFVLAISNDGTPCDTKQAEKGPSIQGVEQEGSDVYVYIEDGRQGIPLARGAIIPKPEGDGWLIFKATGRSPYDDPLPGSAEPICRIRIHSGT